jgi:hypothetical protein
VSLELDLLVNQRRYAVIVLNQSGEIGSFRLQDLLAPLDGSRFAYGADRGNGLRGPSFILGFRRRRSAFMK